MVLVVTNKQKQTNNNKVFVINLLIYIWKKN